MIRRFAPLFACAFVLSSGLLTGCASTEASEEEAAQTEDELRSFGIGEDDNGKSFSILEGQNVVLKLPANKTTGYQWIVKDDDDLGTAKESYQTNSGATGSGGTQKFTWSTKNASPAQLGSHTVKLEYKRSWERNAIKSFKFTIDVSRAGLTCRNVRCGNNTHCVMKGINGGSIPVCIRN